jgi:heme/copper-type cytochrome/quinol oxidase subunit 3
MALTRRHLFHILPLSPWPLFVGIGVFFFVSSLTFYMHGIIYAYIPLIFSLIIIIKSCFSWVDDIIDEATCVGDHTIPVQMGITSGFLLFIVSEIMLFFGFFWAFFHSSLCPSILIGAEFPPIGITIIPPFMFPLYNTCLLLLSGITVTWLHKAIILGSYKESIDSFFLTIFLGFSFFILQMMEYYESPFSFNTSVYGCSFFMLTGLHGFHVFVGILCLFFSYIRLILNHFTTKHHNGLIFAIWYWHFVDVVWLGLFLTVYVWGSNIIV